MPQLLFHICHRESLLLWRHPLRWLSAILFFLMATALFPLALNLNETQLPQIAPAVVWINALFAILLASDHLLMHDLKDGSLEQMLTLPQPTWILLLGKSLNHWFSTGLPLTLMTPLVALQYHLSVSNAEMMLIGLLIGTPSFSFMICLAQTLALPSHLGSILMVMLIFPLIVPVLIFGSSVTIAYQMHWPYLPQLALLGAYTVLAMTLLPLVSAKALRINYTVF